MPYTYPLHLFSAIGVELEYMIVDAEALDVRPIADEVLRAVAGAYVADVEPEGPGGIGWSNELALHVIELKTIEPGPALDPLPARFDGHVRRVNEILAPLGAKLMPTAMHPWMDPDRELRLWPHEASPIYHAFDAIFSCRGHGWANLQSTHLNLPFGDDAEFGRLHAAIRLVLPLLPALAAASPVMDGRVTGLADTRLEVYRHNARRVPSVSGRVIPEPLFTREAYETRLLGGIYRDIAPLDPQGILQHEWLNARGCIARFMRGSIEIRVLDIQECPAADLAIAALAVAAVRAHCEDRWIDQAAQRAWVVQPLHETLLRTIAEAERAVIDDAAYLAAFGVETERMTAGELWAHLANELLDDGSPWWPSLRVIFERGTLATRIVRALGEAPDRERLRRVYADLCECLARGEMYGGAKVESRK